MGNSGDRRGGRVWARKVSYIVNRDSRFGCYLAYPGICSGKAETADHIVPYDPADPSLDSYQNLCGACVACNKARSDSPLPVEKLEALAARGLGPLALQRRREEAAADVGRHVEEEPFRIVYDGAGKPSHRKLLENCGAKAMMLSYWDISRVRKIPQKGYLISAYFPDDVEVYVESGWAKAEDKLGNDELVAYAEEYTTFLEANAGWFTGATEPHFMRLGADWVHQWRREQGAAMGAGIWPIWRPREGMPTLVELAKAYDNVALASEALDGDPVVPPRIRALNRQHQTSFHALSCADPATLRGVTLTTASTQSWASPQMRGETIVWDGTRLVRYRADRKDQARARYKGVVERAGLDYQAIVDDDATEVTRLAIWSYQQLEKSMNQSRHSAVREIFGDEVVTSTPETDSGETPQLGSGGVADSPEGALNSSAHSGTPSKAPSSPFQTGKALTPRDASEHVLLPVFGVVQQEVTEIQDGEQVTVTRPVLQSQSASMRQCNTCVISGNCPAFEPDASCKFALPVEISTKDQLRALLSSTVEMQAGRVAFAKFAEDMNGGYPDPNLSQEIDRLFKMVKNLRDIEDNRSFERITVERQTSGGILSQLFGERAGAAVNQLESGPVQADPIIEATVLGEA